MCIFVYEFSYFVFNTGDMTPTGKVKKGGNLKTLDAKPGLYTRYKSYLNKDKAILKRLLKVVTT